MTRVYNLFDGSVTKGVSNELAELLRVSNAALLRLVTTLLAVRASNGVTSFPLVTGLVTNLVALQCRPMGEGIYICTPLGEYSITQE